MNPEQDDEVLLDEFLLLHYRDAARPIRDCIDLLHYYAELTGVHPGCFATPAEVGLGPRVARHLLDALRRGPAPGRVVAVRAWVEKASIPAYRAMLEAGGPLDAAERAALVERYVLLCRRHRMERFNEQKPFDAGQVK